MRFFACLLILLVAATAFGANTGAIKGYVKDPTGAIVPSAQLVLREVETGASQTTAPDSNGIFQFLHLAPGSYQLTVTVMSG